MRSLPLLLLAGAAAAAAAASGVSPIKKVVELMSDLQTKIMKEGEAATRNFEAFSDVCGDEAAEKLREIKLAKQQIDYAQANIAKHSATVTQLRAKIEGATGDLAEAEADEKAATAERTREHKNFELADAELAAIVDALERAQLVIEKAQRGEEAGAAGAALLQGANSPQASASQASVLAALSDVVRAGGLSTASRSQLSRTLSAAEGDDAASLASLLQAPTGPTDVNYEQHSSGILGTLADLQTQAQGEREAAQAAEVESQHAYDIVKQALQKQHKSLTEDLKRFKAGVARASEARAGAEGHLSQAAKDLKDDEHTLHDLHRRCMEAATDFEQSTKARKAELEAIAKAKKVIVESTDGAAKHTYGGEGGGSFFSQEEASSFLQLSSTRSQLMVSLASTIETAQERTPALIAAAQRLRSAARGGGGDVFGKIRGMLVIAIADLQAKQNEEAELHGFCTKELAETAASKAAKDEELAKLTSHIDAAVAAVSRLTEEASDLRKQVRLLNFSQNKLTDVRGAEKADYSVAEAELSQGLEGLQTALRVLRDYYSVGEADGEESGAASAAPAASAASSESQAHGDGATGIIALLQVAQADVSTNLAARRSQEQEAVRSFGEMVQENAATRASKQQEEKDKRAESKTIKKQLAEAEADREGVSTELSAVHEYLEELNKKCTVKVPSFEERQAKRKAEIEGLQRGLEALARADEAPAAAAFVQIRSLRGDRAQESNDKYILKMLGNQKMSVGW